MKILIIGPVASGKSTLAKKLSNELNTKYYEIDSVVHDDENNIKRDITSQLAIINNIDKSNDWIIEGTLRKHLNILLEKAEKIIYIDIPLHIRKKRIIFRYLKQKIRLEKCSYKPSLIMLKKMFEWTYEFEKNKKDFDNKLNKYENKIEILNSVKIIDNYKI
ncbi:MAG: AAA family ATPase [Candidatus Scatovivens sp.]